MKGPLRNSDRHPEREHRWIDETSILLGTSSRTSSLANDTTMRAQALAFFRALSRFALEEDPTRGFGDFHALVLEGEKTLHSMTETPSQSVAAVARFVLVQSEEERAQLLDLARQAFQPWAHSEKETSG